MFVRPFGAPRQPRRRDPMAGFRGADARLPQHFPNFPRAAQDIVHEQALAEAVNNLARKPGHILNQAIRARGLHPDEAWDMVQQDQQECHQLGVESEWDNPLEVLEEQIAYAGGEGFGEGLHPVRGGLPHPPRGFPGRRRPRGFGGPQRGFGAHGVFDDPLAEDEYHGLHGDGAWGQGPGFAGHNYVPSHSDPESALDLARRQARARAERKNDAMEREVERRMNNGHMGMSGVM
ncbi:MAG: hypothetical protein Q9218_004531 [Villophora microphyllina]